MKCINGGIFVVGGTADKNTNQTEFIDETCKKNRCHGPYAFPLEQRIGMVGTSLGNGIAMFCGGLIMESESYIAKAFQDCYRYNPPYFKILIKYL